MSEVHPLLRLIFEWGIQLGQPYGDLLLVDGIGRDLGLVLGPYRNQNLGLRNQYTHNFNIIGGLPL